MKGGVESVKINNPNEEPPVELLDNAFERGGVKSGKIENPNEEPPVALSDNVFDRTGDLLKLVAEHRGNIEDSEGKTDMGIKAYKSLVVSAKLHEKQKYDKAGTYLLLARHFAHHLRSAALKLQRNFEHERVLFKPDPLTVAYYSLKGITKASKYVLDKSGAFNFTRRGMEKFFESLISGFPKLYQQLLGEEIDMGEMKELLKSEALWLGPGNITQITVQAPEQISPP